MSNLEISIIMPAYNCDRYIKQAIKSVLDQTYPNYEFIIIDDCSRDNTYNIIKEFAKADERIKVLKNKNNSGVAHTRNVGVAHARGSLIAFIDSDDLWTPDKLKKQIDLYNTNEKAKFIYTGSSFIDENNERYHYIMQVPLTINYTEILKQNIISCSSVLIEKKLIINTPMEGHDFHEDFATWLKVLEVEELAYGVNEPLLVYRISRKSKSGNKIKSAIMNYRVYKHIGLNIFKKVYYMAIYFFKNVVKYWRIFKGQYNIINI
jgi:teichuronic acid biosynthesis glycosyltransferase TuaG